MKRNAYSVPVDLLSYDVIVAAASGDAEALAQVARNFDAYLNQLAMRGRKDKHGRTVYTVDLRRKAELAEKLIEATLNWKELI